jgi:hypothetical protein
MRRSEIRIRADAARHLAARKRVRSRIAEIVGRQIVADFEDREHAAHFDVSELTDAGHHRQRVFRALQPHCHVTRMLGHAVLAHRHVGQHFANLGLDAGLVNTGGIRNAVAHRPHGVMRHVTVQRPIAGLSCHKFQIAHLPDADDFGDLASPLRARPASAVRSCDPERIAVQMHGMIPHG